MNSKRLIFLILLVNYSLIAKSQSDEARILATIKASVFSEMKMGIVSKKTFENYISRKLEAEKLKSKGFSDILFYSIPPQILSIDTTINGETIIIKTPACFYSGDTCNLIVGINKNNGKVYKLRGFHNNNFKELYESQSSWYAWKEVRKINRKTIEEYKNSFGVEGIDFKCLLLSLQMKEDGSCLKIFFYKSGHTIQQ